MFKKYADDVRTTKWILNEAEKKVKIVWENPEKQLACHEKLDDGQYIELQRKLDDHELWIKDSNSNEYTKRLPEQAAEEMPEKEPKHDEEEMPENECK